MAEPKTNSLGLRVSPDIKAALIKAAEDERRSMASLAEKILADWLKANGYLK
jgi:hypothetical protein